MKLFADSFFFFAYLSPKDRRPEQAEAYFDMFDGTLVTTAWVLTELADGMAGVEDREAFLRFYDALREEPDVMIFEADKQLFEVGLTLFRNRPDKEWSLTDCISFAVMEREGLTEALTGDHHFEQAGFKALLK
jgi:predicted nucleic acid-binding protein